MENERYYAIIDCSFTGKLIQKTQGTNPYIAYKVVEGYVEDEFGGEHPRTRKVFEYQEGCAEVLNGLHYSDYFDNQIVRFGTEAEALEALKRYKSWCKRSGKELDIREFYVKFVDDEEPDNDEYIAFAPLTEDSETEFFI